MNAPILSPHTPSVGDRRTAPRYLTGGTTAVIGWSEGNEYRTIGAKLIDISVGGFSAYVETFPPRGVAAWLRLDGSNQSRWIKASVIAASKTGLLFSIRRRVRLRFLEACPYDLFKGAIRGFTHEVKHYDQTYEGFDSRYWR
jgi:hypothetical protein